MQLLLKGGRLPLMGAIWPVALVLFGLDYIVRAVVCTRRRCLNARDWRWYAAALLITVIILAWRTDWLLRWRFSAHRAAMEATALAMLESPTAAQAAEEFPLDWPWGAFDYCNKQIAGYGVFETAVFPNERVVFLTTAGFFRAGWGFMYLAIHQCDCGRSAMAGPRSISRKSELCDGNERKTPALERDSLHGCRSLIRARRGLPGPLREVRRKPRPSGRIDDSDHHGAGRGSAPRSHVATSAHLRTAGAP